MNRLLFLVPLLFACCSVFAQTAQPAPSSPSIDGLWSGTLDAGLMKLRIVFHLNSTVTGLSATMDSPDQHASGIPVSQATRVGQALTLEVHVAGGVYQGTINSASDTIAGTWSQSGHEFPLELKAVRDPAAQAQAVGERVRPQNPIRPFPYREEEVSYPNKLQGNTLAGTLTIPPGPWPLHRRAAHHRLRPAGPRRVPPRPQTLPCPLRLPHPSRHRGPPRRRPRNRQVNRHLRLCHHSRLRHRCRVRHRLPQDPGRSPEDRSPRPQ